MLPWSTTATTRPTFISMANVASLSRGVCLPVMGPYGSGSAERDGFGESLEWSDRPCCGLSAPAAGANKSRTITTKEKEVTQSKRSDGER